MGTHLQEEGCEECGSSVTVKVLVVSHRSFPALLHAAEIKTSFGNIFLCSLVPLHIVDISSCHGEYKLGRVRDKIHDTQKNINETLKYSETLQCYLSNRDFLNHFITYKS